MAILLLAALLATALAGYAVKFRPCTQEHHATHRRFDMPFPGSERNFDVQLKDIQLGAPHVVAGEDLVATIMIGVGEESAPLKHPRASVSVAKDGRHIRNYDDSVCRHTDCPIEAGTEASFTMSHRVPSFMPAGEYEVVARLRENAAVLGCVSFVVDIVKK